MAGNNPTYVARCRCGAVEVGAWSAPIVVTACYCDDCQEAARRCAASADAAPLVDADCGTEFMVFRRDRIACIRGADHLQAMRLRDATKTRRMIAGCCATPMYLTFDDRRPWISAFRAAFGADAPPVQLRICTRFRQSREMATDGLPNHPGYPASMILRVLAAWPLMLFSRPVGALP
ncbi:Uncharacterized conserved protein [Enhydrobacter aerosaccus]|uniref:Uncharacterized conserved protein n=1 Tax=Enhydrobacter aerosaccus TaxID=225324 RepID=A0A1T4TCP8_9HYPH|nr:hypothetical protein [Enhydrobacter aerosaccus]SKA38203.1 Uncharacterized conserved protein [Enhydrobacter aerosaccus]